MSFSIIISNSSGKPIYEQIEDQIKALILNGTMKEGDALPSVRGLAKDLRISIITTKHSYEDLERDGFIVTYPGKGSFVKAINTDYIREEGLKQIEEHLTIACEKAVKSGIKKSELVELIDMIYGQEE